MRKTDLQNTSYLMKSSSSVQAVPASSLIIPVMSYLECVRLEITEMPLLWFVQNHYANYQLLTLHLHLMLSVELYHVVIDTHLDHFPFITEQF